MTFAQGLNVKKGEDVGAFEEFEGGDVAFDDLAEDAGGGGGGGGHLVWVDDGAGGVEIEVYKWSR